MKKLMNVLLLSCKKSSELIEKKMLTGLTLIERVQLFIHTSMCDACKDWKKQSKVLDESLKNHFHSHPHHSKSKKQVLSEEIKNSIIDKIKVQK